MELCRKGNNFLLMNAYPDQRSHSDLIVPTSFFFGPVFKIFKNLLTNTFVLLFN